MKIRTKLKERIASTCVILETEYGKDYIQRNIEKSASLFQSLEAITPKSNSEGQVTSLPPRPVLKCKKVCTTKQCQGRLSYNCMVFAKGLLFFVIIFYLSVGPFALMVVRLRKVIQGVLAVIIATYTTEQEVFVFSSQQSVFCKHSMFFRLSTLVALHTHV